MSNESPTFRPRQVKLDPVPLVGTMDQAEREQAAALLVRVCQVLGDQWQVVTRAQLGTTIAADLAVGADPVTGYNHNPFFRPDFHLLADGKYAKWSDGPNSSIEFTNLGYEVLGRYAVAPQEPAPSPDEH